VGLRRDGPSGENDGDGDVSTNWNFAELWETVAEVQPERPAVIRGDRVVSWSEWEARSDAIAARLLDAGLEPGARVAQYLTNSVEYLEAVFASFKAALVPVNTNYRYVTDELVHLWSDSGAEAVVFHGSFAHNIEQIRSRLPAVRLWLWVDDDASPCPDWAEPYETVASSGRRRGDDAPLRSGDDLYLQYTGGTTGLPKGVMWRQDDLLALLNRTAPLTYAEEEGIDCVPGTLAAAGDDRPRGHPAPPLMHGTAAFSSFGILNAGGVVVLPVDPHFEPTALLDLVERQRITNVSIVGDVFARPLLDALDSQPGRWDVSSLRVMLSSGVMWSSEVKEGLMRHAPDLTCVDTLSSSEALGLARSISTRNGTIRTAGFNLGPDAQVIREDGTPIEPGSGEVGLVALGGRSPIGYFNDPVKSASTFRMIGGRRWTTPGDYATIDIDGTVTFLGRGSSCINTGGEKVFPEEVEEALKTHPAVRDAVVVGAPHHRFGQQVVAFVEPEPGVEVDTDALDGHVRARLAGYKVPRVVEFVPSIGRAVNGKMDHSRWKAEAERLVAD
jgi:acyl-CoA synthetase (AMP-forming)/AMP-acid ligase II